MSTSPVPAPEDADQAGPLYLAWDDIGAATTALAQQTLAVGVPQAVVGIVRGGLIPAVWIAHRLGVHDVRTIEVTRTTSDAVNAAKTPLPTVRNPASLGNLAGLDVLLVDDIAGSGTTLAHTAQIVRDLGPARVRTAVLAVNRANWPAGSEPHDRIDHIARLTTAWVVFPWEEQHEQR
ncbi:MULTISPECIES: phosphoribosyltransferase [unclassified Streptomyces]|uniref:phosphoribosyltransferase n=1 Tax=unclassified Streptomyces TaxID=2593676 RepID=UPI0008DD2A98|nr:MULTISPECIES: phosphoribosyltransferase family protein [unclassified Streptomyces]OII66344.1 purine phosphoribosyltransferase [Streptomyces sp. CC77]